MRQYPCNFLANIRLIFRQLIYWKNRGIEENEIFDPMRVVDSFTWTCCINILYLFFNNMLNLSKNSLYLGLNADQG